MDFSHWFLLLYATLAFYVLGITLLAQLVVYPLFAQVCLAEYVTYHKLYSSRILDPVILPGFACFLLPIALIFFHPEAVPLWITVANATCGLLALFVTVLLEIPRCYQLETKEKKMRVIQALIRYSWTRTVGIAGSACLSLAMLMLSFSPV